MLLEVPLRVGFLPLTVPVGVREMDLDGEIWVKLRLIPREPWVGTATWAFTSMPKIKLALAPFRLVNLMGEWCMGRWTNLLSIGLFFLLFSFGCKGCVAYFLWGCEA